MSYGRVPGLRAVGERADGFAITTSRTVHVPVERLFDAFADESGVLGKTLAEVGCTETAGEQMPPWEIAAEFVRCLVLAAVVAILAAQGEIDDWTGGLLLGAVLSIGVPLVLWAGAIIHEKTPWKLASIHAGHWVVKLLVVAVVVSTWQ